jgi:hypothetical protein
LALAAEAHHNANLLVFAALEARNAIEQLWADLLTIVYSGEMTKDLSDRCRRQPDGTGALSHVALKT